MRASKVLRVSFLNILICILEAMYIMFTFSMFFLISIFYSIFFIIIFYSIFFIIIFGAKIEIGFAATLMIGLNAFLNSPVSEIFYLLKVLRVSRN